MTKQEAIEDLKSFTEVVHVMGHNNLHGAQINKVIVQNWIQRLNRIIDALESKS